MSEAVSALAGAVREGPVTVRETGLRGMITLRGDLKSAVVASAATKAAGVEMPGRGEIRLGAGTGLAWMSPDEILVMVPHAEAEARRREMGTALAGTPHLAVNVSDARAVLRLEGAGAREVIAKLCPVDMAPAAFGPGRFRRTRMAQVPAAIWMIDDTTIEIICFRSVADYVFGLLCDAAAPGGEVGFFS